MINYFLKVTICWGLFYLIYTLFLSKETFFRINRWYLLGTLLLGLVIPIIPLDFSVYTQHTPTAAVYIEPLVEQVQKVETEIAVQAENGKQGYGLMVLWFIYVIGVLVSLLRFGKGLWKIYQLYRTATIHKKGNYILVLTNQAHLPFSFFNYLFWSQGTHVEEKDAGTIITHEVAHINQWHSLDIFFLEGLGIFLWFSPPIYWYKKSLKDIHEYLADAYVLKDTKTKQYGHLLLKQAQSGMQLALASHFLDSQLKKRILMMTREQSSNQALMKYLSALPLLLLMVLVFSNPQVRANLNATAQLSIDYFNPNMEVPKISPSLLLWIGGDFDKEKAKKVLEAAYASENASVAHVEVTSFGEKKLMFAADHIKELHKAAIFLVRKFPAHTMEIHDLAIAVAKDKGIALRFHENGESIIYRYENSAHKKTIPGDFDFLFNGQSDSLDAWMNRLVLINNEIAGFYPETINKLGNFQIANSKIIEIAPKEAIDMFGEERGKHGALNFFTDEFYVSKEDGENVVKATADLHLKGNYLVLINDEIVGLAPEPFTGLGDFYSQEVIQLQPKEAIEKYGAELGKNGSMNYFSDELKVVEENGKKVVKHVADLVQPPTISDSILVLVNDEIIGFAPEAFSVFKNVGDASGSDVVELQPSAAIKEYGEALGKNGSLNFLSDEFTVVEENGKKVVKRVEDILKISTSSENKLLIVNGMPLYQEQLPLSAIPTKWIQEWGELSKEDLFMRGFSTKNKKESALYITLIDKYTIVKDAWGAAKVLPKSAKLSTLFPDEKKQFLQVDEMPRLTSCLSETSYTEQKNCSFKAFTKYIYTQIEYPLDAREKGIEGVVKVQFTVELDGTISNPTIINSIAGLDEEVLRIFKEMNDKGVRWQPGHQNEEDVRVVLTKPIRFRIEKEDEHQDDTNKETASSLGISVAPNPTKGPIQLKINGAAGPTLVTIVDMLGQELYNQELVDFNGIHTETIALSNAFKGMVIVRVQQGGITKQEKVLIQ